MQERNLISENMADFLKFIKQAETESECRKS